MPAQTEVRRWEQQAHRVGVQANNGSEEIMVREGISVY